MTYLAYPATTGIAAIDYRITDSHLDPPGITEHLHSEKLIRLPETYWCYPVPEEPPGVGDLPAAERLRHVRLAQHVYQG